MRAGECAPEPQFDAKEVCMLEEHIDRQQVHWQHYFRTRGIEPLSVEYESLAEDYRGEVARVLTFLGFNGSIAQLLPPPRLVRQMDEINLRWRALMDCVQVPLRPVTSDA